MERTRLRRVRTSARSRVSALFSTMPRVLRDQTRRDPSQCAISLTRESAVSKKMVGKNHEKINCPAARAVGPISVPFFLRRSTVRESVPIPTNIFRLRSRQTDAMIVFQVSRTSRASLSDTRSSRGVWLDRARWCVSLLHVTDRASRARARRSRRRGPPGARLGGPNARFALLGLCLMPRCRDLPLTRLPSLLDAGEHPQGQEELLQEVQEARAPQGDAVQDGQGLSLRAG